jgi:chemotaxis signal transduction protein
MVTNLSQTTIQGEVATRNFVSFWVGGRLYGIDILDVREINSETSFTPIFHAPPEVRGYVNIRGQIHLVIDPRLPLGMSADATTGTGTGKSRQQLLIFKPQVAETFALLVDRVGDIIPVPIDRIEAPEASSAGLSAHSAGVCKLDGRLMELLDPRGFLSFKA